MRKRRYPRPAATRPFNGPIRTMKTCNSQCVCAHGRSSLCTLWWAHPGQVPALDGHTRWCSRGAHVPRSRCLPEVLLFDASANAVSQVLTMVHPSSVQRPLLTLENAFAVESALESVGAISGCRLLVQGEWLVRVDNVLVLIDQVAVPPHEEAGGHEALYPHGAPRVDAGCADAHLGAQPITEAVGEAGGGVPVHAGAVHLAQEILGCLLVVCDNGIGVGGAVLMNVVDGLLHAVHQLQGERRGAILVLGRRRRLQPQSLHRPLPPIDGDVGIAEGGLQLEEAAILGEGGVHQHLLHRVAGGGVVCLAVQHDLDGHVQAGVLVHIYVADAIRMAQHGDLGVVLDVRHQGVGAAGDDEVDDIVVGQQVRHALAAGDQADEVPPHLGGHVFDGLHDDTVQDLVAAGGLLAALQQQPVPRPDGQAGNLRQRVGARLEDD
mmetsp:Transcript_6822/g.19668  ORF Transcript_6822/g.19668 Transcript_6822/m.19668 type:complete len:436 (-) Transcript_6822:1878-3185(-)